MIQDPYDLTDDIGEFELCQFSKVKDALEEVVEDRSHDFYFHHDPKHKYSFDERPFQSGAIYGRKQKRKEGENEGSKVTAGRLAPIKSTSQFEEHVKKVATVVEKRKASSSKKSKRTNKPRIDHYLLELCVVVLKEKITKTSIPSVPDTLLACSSSVFSNIDEDNITPTVSSEEPPTKKKKTVYKFKATSLSICLHAPIETFYRKSATTTGVPSGRTTKDVNYDLKRFILPDLENESDSDSVSSDNAIDDSFVHLFTLSKFRKEMMIIAVEQFSEEYGIRKKAVGTKCKLYLQKQWNNSSWTEIASTEELIYNLKDQMEIKSRVRNGVLKMKMSFGKAKSGMSFDTQDELDEYATFGGEALHFSQSDSPPSSPFSRKVGMIMRADHTSNTVQLTELVTRMYQTESCKLYHGFLQEHIASFIRIIVSEMSVRKDESVFRKANELNSIPSNEDLDLRLLNIYAQRHFNDTKDGKLLPQTYCFPPTNPDMMIAPPTYKEWKTTKKASNDILTAENFGSHNYVFRQAQIPDDRPQVVGFNATPSASKDEVVGLTFYLYDNDDDQASVIIDGNPLSLNSSMMDVLDEYKISDELLIINIEKCKFLIKLKSGLHLHLKYNRFHRMTVNTVITLKNISDDYLIIIKECQ